MFRAANRFDLRSPQAPLLFQRSSPLKLLKATAIGILLLSLSTLSSCGTVNRFSTDVFVAASSPFLVVYGGSTDAAADVQEMGAALDAGPFTEVVAFPFYFLWHAGKHLVYSAIHLVDAPLCVFYGLAEAHPNGPEIKPMDYYQVPLPWVDKDSAGSTDLESGEDTGR